MGATRHAPLQTLLEGAFRWALPHGCDEETRRRGRLVVLFALVVVPAIFAFTGFYLASGLTRSATGTSLAFALISLSVFVLRRRSVTAAVHTFMLGGVSGLTFVLVAQGGLESPALGWFTLGPWAAMMLGGRTVGFIWIGVIVALILTFACLDLAGLLPPSEVPAHDMHVLVLLANAGVLSLAAMMAASYESQRIIIFTAMGQARDDAHARARDLEEARDRIEADAKEQRRLELELRSAQKLEAVGRLAAGVAHEINSPLQYVSDSISFTADAERDLLLLVQRCRALVNANAALAAVGAELEALENEIDLPFLVEAMPQAQARAHEGLGRIARIVSAMRELARPEGDALERLDLNHLARTALALGEFELSQVADVELELAADLPWVHAKPAAIGQAILALLSNAAHAVADAGHVRGRVAMKTRQDGDQVALTVEDNGTGIPEAIRERIFDPFFTTKDVGRGSGQGLALARHIVVEQHGGSLTFETELGRGTTFTLRLPASSVTA